MNMVVSQGNISPCSPKHMLIQRNFSCLSKKKRGGPKLPQRTTMSSKEKGSKLPWEQPCPLGKKWPKLPWGANAFKSLCNFFI